MKLIVILIAFCLLICFKIDGAVVNDCSQGSLDRLKLNDLIKKSDLDEICLVEARKEFKKNYNESRFQMTDRIPNKNEIVDFVTAVYATPNGMKTILNHFGDLISHISLDLRPDKEIIKLINDKSCKKLKSFNFVVDENVLNGLEDNKCLGVTRMKLEIIDEFNTSRELKNIFPNLETLDAASLNSLIANSSFPKLKTLNTTVYYDRTVDMDEILINFVTINPQIENLAAGLTNLETLEQISKILHLKSLEISLDPDYYSDYYGDDIHFESVKNLRIDMFLGDQPKIPEKIFFKQLEKFELRTSTTECIEKWFEFINNQVNKRLTTFILSIHQLKKEQFFDIPEKLPNLQTLIIKCPRDCGFDHLNAEEIISFLLQNKNLNKLELNLKLALTTSQKNNLQQKLDETLDNEWNVKFIAAPQPNSHYANKMPYMIHFTQGNIMDTESTQRLSATESISQGSQQTQIPITILFNSMFAFFCAQRLLN